MDPEWLNVLRHDQIRPYLDKPVDDGVSQKKYENCYGRVGLENGGEGSMEGTEKKCVDLPDQQQKCELENFCL